MKDYIILGIVVVICIIIIAFRVRNAYNTEKKKGRKEIERNYSRLKAGMIVQHFKRNTADTSDPSYCYLIISDCAKHTETGEPLVVYMACYGDLSVYARPRDMFYSEVDKVKYPDATQQYRLEEVTNKELLKTCKVASDKFISKIQENFKTLS